MRLLSGFPSLLLLATINSALSQDSFDGYQVLRTAVPNEAQFEALLTLTLNPSFDFWTSPSLITPADVMTSPQDFEALTSFFAEIGLNYEISVPNVQTLLEESARGPKIPKNSSAPYEMNWSEYQSTAVILDYLEYLAENYDFVSTEKLNTTYDGNDVVAIKIEKAGPGAKNAFFDGTAHAREWISPAVVTYLIKELVENHEENAKYVDNINFYIIPVVNPDGYEFSRKSPITRLWRKTRTQVISNLCPGVDLNRNFPFDFAGPGSSGIPCVDTYRGNEALSEPESEAMASLFSSLEPVPELAISYHSAYDAFLYPYGHLDDAYPDNKDELIQLCEDAMAALNEVDGQEFVCMKATDLYPVGGSSADWFASEGARFSYTPELRNNGYFFLLPPKYILPSGKENWAALKVMMDKILE